MKPTPKVFLHHVAVIVEDVPRAKKFYKSVFGLEEIERLTATTSNNRGAWFRLGELELHLQERAGITEKNEQHFALLTEQLDEIAALAEKHGGRTEPAKLINGMSKRCFLYDLDENRVELLQR
jgi:glyoxylase I family protein